MTPLQATCVAIGGRGLLVEGTSGSGKSGLALALMDRGAQLVGDDSLMVEAREDRLVARPHPQTRGLLEVRNLGLLTFPVCDAAKIDLCLVLDPQAPRWIEVAEKRIIEGIALPCVRVWPDSPHIAIKAELALDRYGISQ